LNVLQFWSFENYLENICNGNFCSQLISFYNEEK